MDQFSPADYLMQSFEELYALPEMVYVSQEPYRPLNPCARQLFALLPDDELEDDYGNHDENICSICRNCTPATGSCLSYIYKKYGVKHEDIALSAGRNHP